MFRALLDFLYPRTCHSCGRLLPDEERDICRRCRSMMKRYDPSSDDARDRVRTLKSSGAVSDFICLYSFEEGSPIRALLHALKYRSFPSVGTRLGKELGMAVAERRTGATLIIPVPLSRRKIRERGYNQASSIARGVSLVTAIPVAEEALLRIVDGPSQTSLSREERRDNVRDSFSVSRSGLARSAGKSCLLIDDVITTGATLLECATELREAGATEVIACAVAAASLSNAESGPTYVGVGRQLDASLR